MVSHQVSRLLNIAALVVDRQFRSGINLMNKTLALFTRVLVNHSNRHVLNTLVVIESTKQKRVNDWRDEEYKEHCAVAEDAAHLDAQHEPYISEILYQG